MSAAESERLARVTLARLIEPAARRVCDLVTDLGAVTVLDQLAARVDLESVYADAEPRREGLDPALDLERSERLGLRYVIPGDPEWPAQLDDLRRVEPLQLQGGVPFGLWVRGPMRLDELAASVAIVGSRSSTHYGETVAMELGARLAVSGRAVVSGAAFGIDHAAHRGALAGPPGGECRTAAVLACGADRAYPTAHRRLLEHLAANGAVISEVPPGCAPLKHRFLSRNRIIAALTTGTVVVEAAARSGALNTANWAERLNRTVMGVPGPVTSAPSEGVHQLIRSGAATLVTGAADVLELVGSAGEHLVEAPRGPVRARDLLDERQQRVLEAVPVVTGAAVSSISRAAGIPAPEADSVLGALRDLGLVERVDAGWRLGKGAHA